MTRWCAAIVVATLAGVLPAGAQTAASDKPQTVSGCLQRTDAGTYVLTNVSGGAAKDARLPIIGLIPPSAALRNFVDQKVEVIAVVRDSPTQPGTRAIEIVDLSRLPANTPPVKSLGACK